MLSPTSYCEKISSRGKWGNKGEVPDIRESQANNRTKLVRSTVHRRTTTYKQGNYYIIQKIYLFL